MEDITFNWSKTAKVIPHTIFKEVLRVGHSDWPAVPIRLQIAQMSLINLYKVNTYSFLAFLIIVTGAPWIN